MLSCPTRREMVKALGLGVAAAALPAAPARAAGAKRRPNVLLITSEDNGPHLGCYGDPYARTPHLDRLAALGARFANAYITNPVCSPSRGSILTGLYPHQNGQIGLATHKYAMYRKWPNIVSMTKGAGYRTGMVGKLHVNPSAAFPLDYHALSGSNFNKRNMRQFAAAAEKFVNAGDGPFFLMVNFPDAHFPLIKKDSGLPAKPLSAKDVKTLPQVGLDNERLRGFTANYYNCLSRLDSGVGLLLDVIATAGQADNTLVIYLGDHGAQFSRGKTTLYEGGVRVPFIVHWPGRSKAGLVRDELVSSVDILPTILDAAGIDAPKNLPGQSLSPLCGGKSVPWREYLFTEKAGAAPFWTCPKRTIRDKRYKLHLALAPGREDPTAGAYATRKIAFFIAGVTPAELAKAPAKVRTAYATWKANPAVELYDLAADPHEWVNLADDPKHADVQDRLLKALVKWQKDTADPFRGPAKLKKYLTEMDTVVADKINYRRKKGFRWNYLDYLRPAGS